MPDLLGLAIHLLACLHHVIRFLLQWLECLAPLKNGREIFPNIICDLFQGRLNLIQFTVALFYFCTGFASLLNQNGEAFAQFPVVNNPFPIDLARYGFLKFKKLYLVIFFFTLIWLKHTHEVQLFGQGTCVEDFITFSEGKNVRHRLFRVWVLCYKLVVFNLLLNESCARTAEVIMGSWLWLEISDWSGALENLNVFHN